MITVKAHPEGKLVYYIKSFETDGTIDYRGPYSNKGGATSTITKIKRYHRKNNRECPPMCVVSFTMTNETEV